MNLFLLLSTLLILPYSITSLSVTSLPALRGYFFLEDTPLTNSNLADKCLKESLRIISDVSCLYFPWNVDDPMFKKKSMQEWVFKSYAKKTGYSRGFASLIASNDRISMDDNQYYVQAYLDFSDLPILSKGIYRRIGDNANGFHNLQWRFDPFYKERTTRRIFVRYKRFTHCPKPKVLGIAGMEEAVVIETCNTFDINLANVYAYSPKTLNELPLPKLVPISETDFQPVTLPLSITSTYPPTNSSTSTSTTNVTSISTANTSPNKQGDENVSNASVFGSWMMAVLIVCGVLLFLIIAFGCIMLYLLYKLKPMVIVEIEKVYVPVVPVAKDNSSKKSSKSKKHGTKEDGQAGTKEDAHAGTKEHIQSSAGSTPPPKRKRRKLDDDMDGKSQPKKMSKPVHRKKLELPHQKADHQGSREPALSQPLPKAPLKRSKESNKVASGSSINTSNVSGTARAYKGEIVVDRSGKESNKETKAGESNKTMEDKKSKKTITDESKTEEEKSKKSDKSSQVKDV